MNEIWIYSIGTLLYCLFHATALILSLVYWKRYPMVCVMVLAGSLLNLLALGARIAFPMIWFRRIDALDDRMTFAFINLGISLVNLSGSALYLMAIFTGRSRYTPRRTHSVPREDDDWDRPAALSTNSEPGSTGIQEQKR
jgi:hypothetical protein